MVTGSHLGKEKLCRKYFGDGGLFLFGGFKNLFFFVSLYFFIYFFVFLAIYLLKGSKKHTFSPKLLR